MPDLVVTPRLLVRPVVNDRDFSLMADFFNAAEQNYPRAHFRWPYYTEPYRKANMRGLNAHMAGGGENADRYLFTKGNTRIIGCMNYSTDRLGSARIAYYIDPAFRGRGYASEAHKGCLRAFLQANPRVDGLWEEVRADNRPSRRILFKSGFKKMGSRYSAHNGLEAERMDSFYCSRERGLA